MAAGGILHAYLEEAARRFSDRRAVEETDGRSHSYGELAALSDRVRDRLVRWGVRKGDRVGFYTHKSIDAVAMLNGILKAGAAYVPVDPSAPASRNAFVLADCAVRVAAVEEIFAESFRAETAKIGKTVPRLLLLGRVGGGEALREALDREDRTDPAPRAETVRPDPEDLAYILYTSGSTGKPKGVALSHRHAASFVDWCSETFEPRETDRFSSHAPFHFDLSIHDIHVSLKHGAALVLFGEAVGKDPGSLASLIAEKRISIWYSTPSILTLLVQYCGLEKLEVPALRLVLFAGEVFPIKHLRTIKTLWPRPCYANLYGPTETNVCTWYEIPREIPADRTEPYPIGKACSHCRTKVVDPDGKDVPPGNEGELVVAGPAVLSEYWNLPEQTSRAFLVDGSGERWYKTGDLVIEEANGDYAFLGRRDRMVKRRDYRVELGEIEAGLYKHPAIEEAAAIGAEDEESGVRILVFLKCAGSERPSIVELKRFSAENLPRYMIPDEFRFVDVIPKTSTDKIDYQRLKEMKA
ncbi:MAG: amino acid adenylation domain-containing protein [Candidatus Eisenbacteria bacterium]|nr:amino acid adenylation domain-containing protein [Candidatus Eisenbacteria bacterium]